MAKYDVFISYSRKDKKFVEYLYTQLKEVYNLAVWLDLIKLSSDGRSFDKNIQEALDDSNRLLLIVSPDSMVSEYVTKEWKYALERCKTIIPVLHRGEYEILSQHPQLAKLHAPQLSGETIEKSKLDRVVDFILDEPVQGDIYGISLEWDERKKVERPQALYDLKSLAITDLDESYSGDSAIVGIWGFGGTGKSVMAQSLIRDCDVRRTFPDGIYWIPIGQNVNLTQRMSDLGASLNDSRDNYMGDVHSCKTQLMQHLSDKRCLIVLDDVWNIEEVQAFNVIGSNGHIIFTTRNEHIAKQSGHAYKLGGMIEDQAIELIGKWSGKTGSDPLYKDIARKIDYLPLGLKIIGFTLQDMDAETWVQYYEENLLTTSFANESLGACFQVSVDHIRTERRWLYYCLGIFAEDVFIPYPIVEKFWLKLNPALDKNDCIQFQGALQQLGLIDVHANSRTLTMHDLLHEYTRHMLKKDANLGLKETQSKFLSLVKTPEQSWTEVLQEQKIDFPNMDYLYTHLPHHMKEAEEEQALYNILKETPGWIETQPRNLQYERLMLNIWDEYHRQQKEEASQFLQDWLDKPVPRMETDDGEESPYTAREIAVKCALRCGNDDIIQQAMQHKDKRVRDIGGVVNYYRYLQNRNRGHENQGIRNIRHMVSNTSLFGLPRIGRVRSAIIDIMVLLLYEYQNRTHTEEDHYTGILSNLLIETVQRALLMHSVLPLPAIWKPVKRFLSGFILDLIQERLEVNKEQPDTTVHTTVTSLEISNLFTPEYANNSAFRKIALYFSREQGNLLDEVSVEEHVQNFSGSLGYIASEFALVAHGVHEPDKALEVINGIINHDGQYKDARFVSMIATWRRILMHRDTIERRWLDDYRKMIEQYYDGRDSEWGILPLEKGNYQYHPLVWYAQVWNRVEGNATRPVDLIVRYLRDANKPFTEHILNGFGDPRITFINYSSILEHFTPYMQSPDDDLRKIIVRSLGRLRGKAQSAVDDYLESLEKVDGQLIADIRERSHQETQQALFVQIGEFVTYQLAFGDPGALSWLLDDIDGFLDTGSAAGGILFALDRFLDTIKEHKIS